MVFVQSLRGLSHTKLEDTKPEHLELSVQALDRPRREGAGRGCGLIESERRSQAALRFERQALSRNTDAGDASSTLHDSPASDSNRPPRLPPVERASPAAAGVAARSPVASRPTTSSGNWVAPLLPRCAAAAHVGCGGGSAGLSSRLDAIRRHGPSRSALAAARRADAARRAERLRLRLDLRLACPLAGAVPAADARGDEHRAAPPRAERHEPGHARADRDRERVCDPPGRLERPDDHGDRPGRLRPARDRPAAREGRRVRGGLPDDARPDERPAGRVERHRDRARVGAGTARRSRSTSPVTAPACWRSPAASPTA